MAKDSKQLFENFIRSIPPDAIIKAFSIAVHAEEFIETGEPADKQAIEGILTDPEFIEQRSRLKTAGLLPLKRSE